MSTFWRAAGLSYLQYLQASSVAMRNSLKASTNGNERRYFSIFRVNSKLNPFNNVKFIPKLDRPEFSSLLSVKNCINNDIKYFSTTSKQNKIIDEEDDLNDLSKDAEEDYDDYHDPHSVDEIIQTEEKSKYERQPTMFDYQWWAIALQILL